MRSRTLEVKSESKERKVPIFINTRKPMPTKEDFDLVCRMADDARRHKMDMDAKLAHYALKAQTPPRIPAIGNTSDGR